MLNVDVILALADHEPFAAFESLFSDAPELQEIEIDDLGRVAHLKGEAYALDRSTELLWIGAHFAHAQEWDTARNMAVFAEKLFSFPPGTPGRLYVNMLAMAGDPEHEQCEMSRLILQAGILDQIDEMMLDDYLKLAGYYIENGEERLAEHIVTAVVDIKPDHVRGLTVLGALALSRSNRTKGIELLTRATQLGSEEAATMLRLAGS